MKSLSMMLFVLLSLCSLTVSAKDQGVILIQGNILAADTSQPMTKVTPTTTTNAAQQPQTVYVVSSTLTNRTLATFATAEDANAYAARVTPALAVSP